MEGGEMGSSSSLLLSTSTQGQPSSNSFNLTPVGGMTPLPARPLKKEEFLPCYPSLFGQQTS